VTAEAFGIQKDYRDDDGGGGRSGSGSGGVRRFDRGEKAVSQAKRATPRRSRDPTPRLTVYVLEGAPFPSLEWTERENGLPRTITLIASP